LCFFCTKENFPTEKQETTHYASGVHVVVEGGVISYRVRLFFAEIVMNNKGVVVVVLLFEKKKEEFN